MTTKTKIKTLHPAKSKFADFQADEKTKGTPPARKTFTGLKVTDDDGEDFGGIFRPSEAQLAKINEYTRSPKTADEVVCFSTLSANDLIDRDIDQFTTDTIKGFAKLAEPFSPTGKSYMLSHNKSTLPIGRIFGTGTKKIAVEGKEATFLTNDVYIPNTESNRSFIEGLDFGINWAVSVGVLLDRTECTVCEAPFSSWGYWCMNGHDKGLWYDPNSEETDAWGWPLPVEEGAKGAILTVCQFVGAKDFFELSQVYLGAQYFAQLEKGALGGVIKAAAAGGVPIIGLKQSEAKKLPLPRNEKLEAALANYETKTEEDGSITWTDEHGLFHAFQPEDGQVYCYGRKNVAEDEDENEVDLEAGDDDESEDESEGGDDDENEEGSENDDSEEGDDEDEEGDDSNESEAPAPQTLEAAVAENLKLRASVKGLKAKAALGEKFMANLKADAIDWFVKGNRSTLDGPVDTKSFEALMAAVGDNPDAIQVLIDQNKSLAQAKFPKSVRRSSVEGDPNKRDKKGDLKSPDDDNHTDTEPAKRIHG